MKQYHKNLMLKKATIWC